MRIIFLDVDGVLNNSKTTDRIFGWIGIDPELTNNLKRLYDESNKEEETRIVVSSSWKRDEVRCIETGYQRNDNCYQALLERLTNAGMEVLGYTPDDPKSSWYRGAEILKWIKQNGPISNFVVLDDESFDFEDYPDLYKRFVQTAEIVKDNDKPSWSYQVGSGLEDEYVEKALKILRGEFEDVGDNNDALEQ